MSEAGRITLLICGSRRYSQARTILAAVRAERARIAKIIQGEARGADSHAKVAARMCGVDYDKDRRFEAQWSLHGKAAGPIRNTKMLDEGKPDECWAFVPSGVPLFESRGTCNMVWQALRTGVTVRLYDDTLNWRPVRLVKNRIEIGDVIACH